LIHAIIDALLGAIGSKDIGQMFPDSDPKYKDIRSTELLKEVVDMIKTNDVEILNIDSIVVAESPRLAPYIYRMKEVLSGILGISQSDLGIKAKTHEGIGVIGQGEAIACLAQVLVKKRDSSY
jgi:2-C-methyl-D-erythritol 2,4-cyclodiphosphate synthase